MDENNEISKSPPTSEQQIEGEITQIKELAQGNKALEDLIKNLNKKNKSG